MKRGCLAVGLLLVFLLQFPPCGFPEEQDPFSAAAAAYRERRLDQAFVYAKRAVQQSPDHVDALALLGELYYMKQQLPEARDVWERALRLAPSRGDIRKRLDQLEKEAPLEKGMARSDTYPFVVRFAEGQIPVDLGDLRELLREVYRGVGQQFDCFPDHPIAVILYSEDDFNQVRGMSHQAAGLYDGKIRLPIRKARPGHIFSASQELKRVLWHEYTHAVVHDIAKGKCPTWLNEGLAVLEEMRIYERPLPEFREAFNSGKLYSWSAFWDQPYDPNHLALQYEQGYMMAGYLVKQWGWSKMSALLRRLAIGYPIDDAMRAEYRMEPATIEKEWHSWLKRNL